MARKLYERFTKEFKIEAVRQAEETNDSVRQVARVLGIKPSQIYKWRREMKKELVTTSRPKEGKSTTGSEMQRLQKGNERLKAEIDILKKAAAYFAREIKWSTRSSNHIGMNGLSAGSAKP